MSTKRTLRREPATTELIVFRDHAQPSDPVLYPNQPKDILIPEILLEDHEFYDDRIGDKTVWKSCENYRITHPVNKQAKVLLSHNGAFAPHWYEGTSNSLWSRYRGYVGGGSYVDVYGAAGEPIAGLPQFRVYALDGTFVPPPANLEALNSKALSVMLPRVKEELSLVNFVLELKDFKNLLPLARRLIQLVPLVKRFAKGNPLRTIRDLLRLPSELYLTYQFAIAPFIKDIRGLWTSLSGYEREINRLISQEGGKRTRHFSYAWSEFANSSEVTSSGLLEQPSYILDTATTFRLKRQVIYEPTIFHAEIQYNYNYTAYQRAHAFALGLLDKLGINFNTQIVWNALPWSFVVDWVLDVNRFLGQYGKVQNMEPTVNILQYLWSVKRSRKIYVDSVIATVAPFVDLSVGTQVSLPVVTETAYRRQVGLPGYSSLTGSGLSPKELTLGAALVVAQRRRRTKRR